MTVVLHELIYPLRCWLLYTFVMLPHCRASLLFLNLMRYKYAFLSVVNDEVEFIFPWSGALVFRSCSVIILVQCSC